MISVVGGARRFGDYVPTPNAIGKITRVGKAVSEVVVAEQVPAPGGGDQQATLLRTANGVRETSAHTPVLRRGIRKNHPGETTCKDVCSGAHAEVDEGTRGISCEALALDGHDAPPELVLDGCVDRVGLDRVGGRRSAPGSAYADAVLHRSVDRDHARSGRDRER